MKNVFIPSSALSTSVALFVALSTALAGCSGQAGSSALSTGTAAATAAASAGAESADSMQAVLNGAWRSSANKARDGSRHPAATLAFFDIDADETVVEISPGGGWYTEVIAPYLKSGGGTYIAATRGNAGRDAKFLSKFNDADIFGEINVGVLGGEGIDSESADTVLTFRNIHNWMRGDTVSDVFDNAYAALKPGGVFGVVEHRLPASVEQDPQGRTGYVHQDYVIELAEDAGFELAGTSEINANPKDNADHPFGVWTLPPVSATQDRSGATPEGFDPAKYLAIGESDRFTLKFIKPAADK